MNVHLVHACISKVCVKLLPAGMYICHSSIKNYALKSSSAMCFSGSNAPRFIRCQYQHWTNGRGRSAAPQGMAGATWGAMATNHSIVKEMTRKWPQKRLQRHKTEEILQLEPEGGIWDELQVEWWLWSDRMVGVLIEGKLSYFLGGRRGGGDLQRWSVTRQTRWHPHPQSCLLLWWSGPLWQHNQTHVFSLSLGDSESFLWVKYFTHKIILFINNSHHSTFTHHRWNVAQFWAFSPRNLSLLMETELLWDSSASVAGSRRSYCTSLMARSPNVRKRASENPILGADRTIIVKSRGNSGLCKASL